MKKYFMIALIASLNITPAAFARENFYLEMAAGGDRNLLHSGASLAPARVGGEVHLYMREKPSGYYGADAHVRFPKYR